MNEQQGGVKRTCLRAARDADVEFERVVEDLEDTLRHFGHNSYQFCHGCQRYRLLCPDCFHCIVCCACCGGE